MSIRSSWWLGALSAVFFLGVSMLAGAGAAAASDWEAHRSPTLFVNNSILSGYAHGPCEAARYTTIAAAVAAAAPRSHIVVCPSTYHEGVLIEKPLVLIGVHAVIDASSSPFGNGIQIAGPGGSGSTVTGFKIEGAKFEGILVGTAPVPTSATSGAPAASGTPVSHVAILGNTLVGNGTGFGTTGGECYSTPEAPGDCGETIHLVAVTDSLVAGNYVAHNVGGILLTDEFGPTSHDIVVHNQTIGNTHDCGITLAGHSSAAVSPATGLPTAAAGVFDNLIAENVSNDNGVAGQGAGILLGGGAPFAGVYSNVIRGNIASGNGLPGVTIHQHLAGDLNNNVIESNVLSNDNLDGDFDFATASAKETTGILVASGAPPGAMLPPPLLPKAITGTTIRDNRIYAVKVGIWTLGLDKPSTTIEGNLFGPGVTTPISEN